MDYKYLPAEEILRVLKGILQEENLTNEEWLNDLLLLPTAHTTQEFIEILSMTPPDSDLYREVYLPFVEETGIKAEGEPVQH